MVACWRTRAYSRHCPGTPLSSRSPRSANVRREPATMELGGPTSADIIARATENTLRKADELGCRSLALVAFGTGVGGFPLEDAARLMVDTVRQHQPSSLERIVFAVHGEAAEQAFRDAVQR